MLRKLCGENGTEKSTLLEAIAVAYGFNPIERGVERKKYGYFLRMEYSDLYHPSMGLHERSHVERFLTIIHNNMSSKGLFLLDSRVLKDKILDVIIDNLEYLGGVVTNIFSEGISQRCEEY